MDEQLTADELEILINLASEGERYTPEQYAAIKSAERVLARMRKGDKYVPVLQLQQAQGAAAGRTRIHVFRADRVCGVSCDPDGRNQCRGC